MLFYCGFYKIFLRFRVWWGFTRWGWEGRGGTKKIQRKRWGASQIATVVFIYFIMFATVVCIYFIMFATVVCISSCLHPPLPGPVWARVPGLETADSWGSGLQLNFHQNPVFIWTQIESTIAGYNMHVYNCIIYENIVYLESRFLTMTMIVGNQFMVFPWFSLSCTPGLPAGLHIGVLTSSDQ